jgi:hypothetical protein
MSVDTAAADRLPWLADEPKPQRAERRRSGLLPWAAAALVTVAGGGFWLGTRSVEQSALPALHRAPPTMTVQLPPPQPVAPQQVAIPAQPEVRPSPVPEVRPAPSREVRIARPPQPKPSGESASPAQLEQAPAADQSEAQASTPVPVKAAPPEPVPFVMPKPWNPRVFAGAAGRVVQVGAFGSITQAKRGWWFMTRAYPAMSHLPAVVRPTRNSKGRVFYRFQVGTTSQAHSEVLCQRMEKIRFSCAVVGLPWKAKVER